MNQEQAKKWKKGLEKSVECGSMLISRIDTNGPKIVDNINLNGKNDQI
jgi:hypothetical protein